MTAFNAVPLNAAVSPNLTLFVTVTSGLSSVLTSVHSLPRAASSPMQIPNDVALQRDTLSLKLTLAMLSKRSTEDITQPLSQRSIPMSTVVEVIDQVHGRLEDNEKTWPNLVKKGTAVAKNGKPLMTWLPLPPAYKVSGFVMTASCMISVGAVWQLISLSTWLIDFVEKVMKEAILSYNVDDIKPEENSAESTTCMSLPLFTVIAVLKFTVFSNGLPKLAYSSAPGASAISSGGVSMRVRLRWLHKHIRKTLQRINHSAAVDKPKLFLKPADLVDGIVRLSLETIRKITEMSSPRACSWIRLSKYLVLDVLGHLLYQ
ncbi:hypothetical protein IMY05_C4501000500 [Salix suchowensis]|nr:hypothetical protein IMY05_C4501000500 [Salix suchowensis]